MSEIVLKAVQSKNEWEHFIDHFPDANFLQSWNWGVFQQSLGKKVVRFVVFNAAKSDQPIAMFQAVREAARRGSYLAIAGGPLHKNEFSDAIHQITPLLKNLARELQCLFVRIRPQTLTSEKNLLKLKDAGFTVSPMHLTADLTLQLDLHKTDQQLLMEMRKNTRSAIRKAEQIGLRVTFSTDLGDVQQFYEYQLALASYHHFIPFSKEFLEKQFQAFSEDNQVCFVHTWLGDELIASAFVLFYRNEAVYHYGISTELNREYPGSVYGQWQAILEARRRGCTRYNFWGIAPKDHTKHRFSGVSLFKRGFGGEEVAYIPAHDLRVSPLYLLTYVFERIRAHFRHLD